jgi:hypothetical protein
MSTWINEPVIMPYRTDAEGRRRFCVFILRGMFASGNSGAVKPERVASDLLIDQAVAVCDGCMHIERLDPYEYAHGLDEAKP